MRRIFLTRFFFPVVLIFFPLQLLAELRLVNEFIGSYYSSADAEGTNSSSGTLRVNKVGTATVYKAFLMASSHGVRGNRTIEDGDVTLAGESIDWDSATYAGIPGEANFFHNVYADVTELVATIVDPLDEGIITLPVTELSTSSINGVALFVVFQDPTLPERTIFMYVGAQSTTGDSFNLSLSRPLGSEDVFVMGLGVSHGYQTLSGSDQVNIITVNGQRLTSSAGGEDDGATVDGALITLGGIGDSSDNPDPDATSFVAGFNTDDEYYNLLPFTDPTTTNIKIESVNPSNDDDIFFAYFEISTVAEALPVVQPPTPITELETLNPDLPTIVLTHGLSSKSQEVNDLWTDFGSEQAAGILDSVISQGTVNIVQYVWEDAFHAGIAPTQTSYLKARNNTFNAGNALGKQLIQQLGQSYDQPLHFVGHSLGTIVNSYATAKVAAGFTNIQEIQFTALDRPDNVTAIPGIWNNEEARYGFDSNFFATVLPMEHPTIQLRVDNYFSLTGAGVGDVTNGSTVYNHPALVDPNDIDDVIFEGEGVSNNHSGVQQWYRWTMSPNTLGDQNYCDENGVFDKPLFFDSSLDPCQSGWAWSTNEDLNRFPAFNGGAPITTTNERIEFNEIAEYGCRVVEVGENYRVTCVEQSTPFMAADVVVPDSANYISFDYQFSVAGDGDYAAVMLNNQVFWLLEGSVAEADGTLRNTGPIQIPITENNARMKIALYGINNANAEIVFENFQFLTAGASDNNPPESSDLSFTGKFGETIVDQLTATDIENSQLSFHVMNAPGQGDIELSGSDGSFTYTPDSADVTEDQFKFRINDGELNSAIYTADLRFTETGPVTNGDGSGNGNSGAGSSTSGGGGRIGATHFVLLLFFAFSKLVSGRRYKNHC